MPTDFFQQQDNARGKTLQLLCFFAFALIVIVALFYFPLAYYSQPPAPKERVNTVIVWNPALLGGVIIGVLAVVGGGALFKISMLSSGGQSVAEMLGGELVPSNTADPKLRRLLNIVEEMAIAAGMPVPPCYVLSNESGINAFAAGYHPGDAVVAVSKGCLDYLTRDELQGVVAHEFSHILNGDMRLNIRLIGIIFGLIAMAQIGRILFEVAGRTSTSSSSNSKDGPSAGLMIVLLGVGMLILGFLGYFLGSLIQAAISRQREFLADASAVQFTRNPDGIGGALKKIGGMQEGSRIKNSHAGEVSHMFFSNAFAGLQLGSLLATHPPLDERIRRLDPTFDGEYPEVRPISIDASEERISRSKRQSAPAILPGVPIPFPTSRFTPEVTASRIGNTDVDHLNYAEELNLRIPAKLQEAAREPFSGRALVYCLLLDSTAEIRQKQLASIKAGSDLQDYLETLKLADSVRDLPETMKLPLLDLTISALRQMSKSQHRAFRRQVQELIDADERMSLFEYTMSCVLNRHLDAGFGVSGGRSRGSVGEPTPDAVVVLSSLAWLGTPQESTPEGAFRSGVATFLGHDDDRYRLLNKSQCDLKRFDEALRNLAEANGETKKRFLMGCTACILHDRTVTVREAEALRAIADTLGCPMPPIPG